MRDAQLASPDLQLLDLAVLVANADAAATRAADTWQAAIATHILALTAQAEEAARTTARWAAELLGTPDKPGPMAEGGEELELIGWEAADAHRYRQEASYWLEVYRGMACHREHGRPAVTWDFWHSYEDDRTVIDATREDMRRAQFGTLAGAGPARGSTGRRPCKARGIG